MDTCQAIRRLNDVAVVAGIRGEAVCQSKYLQPKPIAFGVIRSGMGAYAEQRHTASTLRRYSFGLHLAIAQTYAKPVMSISSRYASVWSSSRQTPGPSCPYPSDRPPSGHRPGRRKARHVHILQIGLRLAIAQADAKPVMSISFR